MGNGGEEDDVDVNSEVHTDPSRQNEAPLETRWKMTL